MFRLPQEVLKSMIKAPAMKAIKKKIEKDIYGVGSIGLFTDLDRESLAIRQKPGLEEHSGLEPTTRDKQCSMTVKAMHPSTFQTELNSFTHTSTLLKELTHHSQKRNLVAGRAVHAQIIRTGTSTCTQHANVLVNFYAKCGQLPKAHSIFNAIICKDVVSWNSLITGYSQNGGTSSSHTVMQLFRNMRAQNILPNAYTLAGIFKAESSLQSCTVGRQAHALVVKMSSFGDIYVDTSLVGMYCKAGLVQDGLKVFALMPERNTYTWSTMVSGYATRGRVEEAVKVFNLFLREKEDESDSDYVFTAVLSSLAETEYVGLGRQIHCITVKNGLLGFVALSNALVTMYSKCESLTEACKMFDSSGDRNSITWSAMVTGYSQNGESLEAVKLFSRMFSAGIKPSEYTIVGVLNACSDICYVEEGKQLHSFLLKLGYERHLFATTALVDMYGKGGCLADARKGFDCLQERDVALWTSIISGYVQNSDNEEALVLYRGMKTQGIIPNEPTMASILKACSSLATLELGKQVHGHTIKHGFGLEVPIGSALSTMYSKCGVLEDGNLVFRRTPNKDVVSWNAMISGLSHNGQGDEALELFEEMLVEGTEPDDVTFVNIISACSHKGFVERGWSYFHMMSDQYGIDPKVDHYACMVDLLSRAGQLKEAKEFIESASIDHGLCLWRILLSACKNHGNCELGAYAGEKLIALGSRESSTYVQLSGIYTALGRMRDVERIWKVMKENGVNKEVGCSWIELKNQFHVFVVGDTMHPRIEETKDLVCLVSRQMLEEGFIHVLDFSYDEGAQLCNFFMV
ncbi:PREDICTED: pentatricopeptide repeat-containing protein At2g33680-like isoform X1 [Camelina sativa]|uniref:Pentatricopeptide repeat-containing protein At2g33680-like isoform X1 n=2 Tax=Camelina sativa TaxID=90675 RepID=A0ABM1R2C4_CAMSA|nr:PREDICTED: pentatricopeptide repeat-containing protein At2g33680-like isoform X1 [Camelina sativa]